MNSHGISSLPVQEPQTEPVFAAIIDWIDRELGEVYGHCCGRGGNILLELRRVFAEPSLSRLFPRFLAVLPKVEKNHYLLSFRIRTLLSSQFQVRVSDPLERAPAIFLPLPATAGELRNLRSFYFEHSEVLVPLHDIRMEFIPGTCPVR